MVDIPSATRTYRPWVLAVPCFVCFGEGQHLEYKTTHPVMSSCVNPFFPYWLTLFHCLRYFLSFVSSYLSSLLPSLPSHHLPPTFKIISPVPFGDCLNSFVNFLSSLNGFVCEPSTPLLPSSTLSGQNNPGSLLGSHRTRLSYSSSFPSFLRRFHLNLT